MPCILQFRRNLRIENNPVVQAALETKQAILPIYILSEEEAAGNSAEAYWLSKSLQKLNESLQQLGSRLYVLNGPEIKILPRLAQAIEAGQIIRDLRYEPTSRVNTETIQSQIPLVPITEINTNLLLNPTDVLTNKSKPFVVFTQYWNHAATTIKARLLPAPTTLPLYPLPPSFTEATIKPRAWHAKLGAHGEPGEVGAHAVLTAFVQQALANYTTIRNFPAKAGTSKLSPHLHFGEISPHTIWQALAAQLKQDPAWYMCQFAKEIGWREFSHQILYHFPFTPQQPLQARFQNIQWQNEPAKLKAWQTGQTGFPIVDAGMRELWATGWMHNRVRMVVASFLVKDLLIDWQLGAEWFAKTLIDADLAQNTLGWQWAAGCGADAAPYFRVFNPYLQGKKFDKDGEYVAKWCPELRGLPPLWIHRPAVTPQAILNQAGVKLGETYPHPIVDHAQARITAVKVLREQP